MSKVDEISDILPNKATDNQLSWSKAENHDQKKNLCSITEHIAQCTYFVINKCLDGVFWEICDLNRALPFWPRFPVLFKVIEEEKL